MNRSRLIVASLFAVMLVGTGIVPAYSTPVIAAGVSGPLSLTTTVPTFPSGTLSGGTQVFGVNLQLVKKTAPSRLPFDDTDTWDGTGTSPYRLFSWTYSDPATLAFVNAPFLAGNTMCTDAADCNRKANFRVSVTRASPATPPMPPVSMQTATSKQVRFGFSSPISPQTGLQPGDVINMTFADGYFNFPTGVTLADYEFRFIYTRRNTDGSGGPIWWPANVAYNPAGTAAAAQVVASSAPTAEALVESARVTISPVSPTPSSYTITASPQVNGVTRSCTITPPATNCIVPGLLAGVSYTFTNRVNDVLYSASPPSSPVVPTIPVVLPQNRSATDYYANLNGTDTWLSTTGNGPIPAANTNDFTAEMWVYDPSDRNSTDAVLISQGNFSIQLDKSGRLDQEIIVNFRGREFRTLAKLPQDTWVHLLLASSSSTLPSTPRRFWLNINGVEVFNSGDVVQSADAVTSGPLVIGGVGSSTSATNLFKGRVDQVKIWNGVLNSTSGGKSMHTWGSNIGQSGVSLLAHYDFNNRTLAGNKVFNKAASTQDLLLNAAANTSPFVDVKSTHTGSGKTSYIFHRTYLTEGGGWPVPSGLISIEEALVVGGGGAGGSDGGTGGGGGAGQFGTSIRVSANQTLGVVVGQGGTPAISTAPARDGQVSSLSLNGNQLVAAPGGAGGRGYQVTTVGAGGRGESFTGFERFEGGSGGLGTVGAATNLAARSGGSAGTELTGKFNFAQPLRFGGGGGGGIIAADADPAANNFQTGAGNMNRTGWVAIAHAAGGLGGGGEGAGIQEILNSNGKYNCNTAPDGLGVSIGGSGFPNTGGGGGAGSAGGSGCRTNPSSVYDGERNLGGFGGAGVVVLSFSSDVLPPVPDYTVSATIEANEVRADWGTMTDAAAVRKVVQYRVGNGFWWQILDSATATTTTIPKNISGIVEFRVARYDTASARWGEWVYSNQVELAPIAQLVCAGGGDPMVLKYEAIRGVNVQLRFTRTLTPVVVSWGDGTQTAEFTTTTVSNQFKMYNRSGPTTIEICGKFEGFHSIAGILTEIVSWGDWWTNSGLATSVNRTLSYGFANMSSLTKVPATFPTTVTDTSFMFASASNLNDPNLIGWNVSGVINASNMFNGARSLNQDLSNWDLRAATDVRRLLSSATSYNQKPPLRLRSGTVLAPLLAENMLDMSGISDQIYGETMLHWAGLTGSNQILNVRLGAVDKTALCGLPRNAVLALINPSGVFKWTITDKTNRDQAFTCPTVTITAANTQQVYGDPVPSVGFTVATSDGYTGPNWQKEVTCKAVVKSVAVNTSPAGTVTTFTDVLTTTPPIAAVPPVVSGTVTTTTSYETQCSGPPGSAIGAAITYVNGTHTISKRAIAITIKNSVKPKGLAWETATTSLSGASDTIEYAITNGRLVGSDLISVKLDKGSRIGSTNQHTLNGAVANLNGSSLTDSANERYTFAIDPGVLTLSSETYTVTAKNRTKVYGDVLTLDNLNGWTCEEEVTGEATSGADCRATLTTPTNRVTLSSPGTAATAGTGTWEIDSSVSGDMTNYEVVSTNGGLVTVTKRPLYVRPNALVAPAGSATPTYTYDIVGFANADSISDITSDNRPTCSSGYNANTPWGTELDITCSGGNPGDNYYFVYESAKLNVPDFSTLSDLTPGAIESNDAAETTLVPFSFLVQPFLSICFATLEITYLPKNGEFVFTDSVTNQPTNLRAERVSVDDKVRDTGFLVFDQVLLPKGDYTYQVLLDGNCAVEPVTRSLKIAPRASSSEFSPRPPFLSNLPNPMVLNPVNAKPNVRTKATITGQNLANVVRVRIGGKTVKVVAATQTTLNFRIPKLKPGRYDILLVMRDGTTQRWENQVRITGRSASATVSREFRGFTAGSSRITPAMKRAITKYLNDNKARFSTIECVGYTDGPFVRRTDVPLSMNRAKVVCNLARSLGYEVVSRSYVNERTPGAQLRKVKLILGK